MTTEAGAGADRPGSLYVVATPIGNLEDITLRAIRILKEADLVACEDTRHTRKLLSHLGIRTPLVSYFRERERNRAADLLGRLERGETVALVSDAGTPSISDPGAILIQQARSAGIPVVPIPGPSALTTALSVSGIRETHFYFAGFPPVKKKARISFFRSLARLSCPIVLYESPRRIGSCLRDAHQVLGDRQAMLFRELTKVHEEVRHGSLARLAREWEGVNRGEFVLVIDKGPVDEEQPPAELDDLLRWYRARHYSLRDAVEELARELGQSRSSLYRRALNIWSETEVPPHHSPPKTAP